MQFTGNRSVLIAISLASIAVGSFGKLAISGKTKSENDILLNCTAEDDRAALIWNDDLQRNSSDKNFSTIRPVHDPKCAIVAPSRCIVKWKISNQKNPDNTGTWKLVHSLSNPMRPVFDSRWEGFQQYSFPSEYGVHHKHGEFLEFSRAIVFSIRGKGTASFKLCEHYNATQNPCIPVTIPNDSFPLSEICVGQVQWIEVNNEYTCTGKIIPLKNGESPINESEWHTFTLHSSSGNPSASRYLFMKSLSPGKIRYHDYHYFLTEKENSKLSTSEFNHTENIFCIELLVSLCSTCELNVQLVDSSNVTQIIGTITGNQSADSNLPIWKFDKLNVTLEGSENRFRLEILSVMKQYSTDARWAVDSFRKCQPEGTLRSVSFRVESAHSNITCQKLSYTGSSVVKYEATVMDGEFQQTNQHLGWLAIPLILATCIVSYIIHQKRKNRHTEIESLSSAEYSTSTATPMSTPGDWPFECHPHPMKLKEFESDVKKAVQNGELEIEYTILPKGLMHPCRIGNLPENKSKNRYGNLIAYDHSRVILKREPHNSGTDYINANYIQGYSKGRYIATQGPKTNTVVDFWSMIWQEDVRVVAMLVNVLEGKKKMCEQYWPEVEREVTHGDITIWNLEQRVYADYTCRTLELTALNGTESRQVKHLQYTGWPDQGVPIYSHSIVEYLNELRATPPGLGPIVVHCHAGTGRTGTIILCDLCLKHVADNGTVDVFGVAKRMYGARANMLDNLQQYILAHLMPTQCLLLLPTKIPCNEVTVEQIAALKKDLKFHIRRLVVSAWKDKALRPWEPPKLQRPSHLTKNRFPKLMPVEHSLVSLKRYPKHDSTSEYISAVSVDGVKSKGQYLASQLPMASTLSDFWRLVAEQNVELVVILQRPTADSFACVDVVPREREINPVPFITVRNNMRHQFNRYFTTDKLLLTDTSEKRARIQNVTVLTCNDWKPAEEAKAPPPESLVSLWLATERVSRPEVPTLVLCHDGVTGCGLYIALSFLLERMALEQECDVILAVRTVRQSRSEFVYSREQFEYLYDAALDYVDNFSTYSNFA